jgi:hypothetical protein
MAHLFFVIALATFGAAAPVSQQPTSRFQLEIATKIQPGAASSRPPRPASPRSGTWRDLEVDKPIRLVTFMAGQGCGFFAGSTEFSSAATFGWRIEATPITLAGDHAVVRLRWIREVVNGKPSGLPAVETVVMLRPGDDVPLDSAVLANFPIENCRGNLATLVVALKEKEPYRARVVSTDLWLVHRDGEGREQTEHVMVRGEFHAPMPFFFADRRLGRDVLDVHGELLPRPGPNGRIKLEFDAVRRTSAGPDVQDGVVLGFGRTALTLAPDDVTEVVLPLAPGGRPLDPALVGHSLSIRIRTRQIR